MKPLSPMFLKGILPIMKSTKLQNSNNGPVQRKKRSDAKHDVKIPLTAEQRQTIKILAKHYDMSVTGYCSQLLGLFLARETGFAVVTYSAAEKRSVHANLSITEYKLLFNYSVKWDCSLRQAAHRILTTAINVESRGIHYEEL